MAVVGVAARACASNKEQVYLSREPWHTQQSTSTAEGRLAQQNLLVQFHRNPTSFFFGNLKRTLATLNFLSLLAVTCSQPSLVVSALAANRCVMTKKSRRNKPIPLVPPKMKSLKR
jgi:hypothetical protein